jgi:hypothetical protein
MKAFMSPGRTIPILLMTVLLISCSRLSVIKPVDPSAMQDNVRRCHVPFIDLPHRFVHAIEVSLPGGSVATVVGVSVIDPVSDTVHSAIMTIEGFVLFDARYDKEIHVNRAVPPFNGEQFAEYLMKDVRLIFLAPKGRPSEAGRLENGSTICRYSGNQDGIVDVITHQDGTFEIEKYSDSNELLRIVKAFSLQDRFPQMVELDGFGFREYSLRLKLISAEQISPDELRLPSGETPGDDE